MQNSNHLLILQTGDAPESVRREHGNFDRMFILAGEVNEARVQVVYLPGGERPEAPETYAGVMITGSEAMVTDKLPWSEYAADWLRRAVAGSTPVFGACYGHQLLAYALGGKVDYHPDGMELGTQAIELLPAAADDALLTALPRRFGANLVHSQSVLTLPPGATVLGRSAHDPHQILRYGLNVITTQFHPEFTAAIMRSYLVRMMAQEPKRCDNYQHLEGQIVATPHSQSLLARFVRRCLRGDVTV